MSEFLPISESTDSTDSLLDRSLAKFLAERSQLDGEKKRQLQKLIQKLSNQISGGDSCIPVDSEDAALVECSGLTSTQNAAPLVLENARLYIYRYWSYEERLARQLKELIKPPENIDNILLDQYFSIASRQANPPQHNWQREAAQSALSQSFSIITGGPGTGKTTTVVKIVAMLLEQAHSHKSTLNIALAAPTGKAAMRLQQSIVAARDHLPCTEEIQQAVPAKVVTLHRLLRSKYYSPYFHHRADNPLPYDLVIVDEASMVDLALMSKLVDALKPDSKLILLGDRNQLASIESGAVLADLIDALPENSIELKESFRFDENIKVVAEGVNDEQAEVLWDELSRGLYDNVTLLSQDVVTRIVDQNKSYWELIRDGSSFAEIMTAFGKFQSLATNRVGPLGVVEINDRVENKLADLALIERENIGGWYRGRPVIVTRNITDLGLFNGDIGITLVAPDGHLRVYFESEEGGRDFSPSRLSHCETAYVMTVHKSQGSEFDEVLVLFPEVSNPVLTKELVYTAITRAKKRVELAVTEDIWLSSVKQKIERHSGLVEKLIG